MPCTQFQFDIDAPLFYVVNVQHRPNARCPYETRLGLTDQARASWSVSRPRAIRTGQRGNAWEMGATKP